MGLQSYYDYHSPLSNKIPKIEVNIKTSLTGKKEGPTNDTIIVNWLVILCILLW
jgi:hypothetical protein